MFAVVMVWVCFYHHFPSVDTMYFRNDFSYMTEPSEIST